MSFGFYLLVFAGSALLSASAVFLSIRIARRWNIYDRPDMARKTQSEPVPKLGGIAVAATFVVVTTFVLLLSGREQDLRLALGVLVPGLAIALLGFWDDQRHLNPYLRLTLQGLAATAVWWTGTRLDVTGVVVVDFALFVLWVMAIVNGLNLLDNSDGLAGSTALIASLGAATIAVLGGQVLIGLLGLALAGVAVGFLWHNWYPARVYLGDSGAYFLGFMVAVLVVRLRPDNLPAWQGIVVAVLLLILPLMDTAFVVVKRIASGIHPFTAGRDHLSHQLQRRGATIPGSVVQLQVISIVCTLLALTLVAMAR